MSYVEVPQTPLSGGDAILASLFGANEILGLLFGPDIFKPGPEKLPSLRLRGRLLDELNHEDVPGHTFGSVLSSELRRWDCRKVFAPSIVASSACFAQAAELRDEVHLDSATLHYNRELPVSGMLLERGQTFVSVLDTPLVLASAGDRLIVTHLHDSSVGHERLIISLIEAFNYWAPGKEIFLQTLCGTDLELAFAKKAQKEGIRQVVTGRSTLHELPLVAPEGDDAGFVIIHREEGYVHH